MKRAPVYAAANLAAMIALPAEAISPEVCVTIDNDRQRLECYDRSFGRENGTPEAPEVRSDWNLRIEKSRIDDSTNAYLTLVSPTPAPNFRGRPTQFTLWLVCAENTTVASIHFGRHPMPGTRGRATIQYRVDDRPTRTVQFTESKNLENLGLWKGAESIPWIKSLFGGANLFVRAIPGKGARPFDADFPIAGIDDRIKPLREACHW